jgi:transcription initiation factor TFIIIB Brf1 subunit/transcription initiation factor TFIIB
MNIKDPNWNICLDCGGEDFVTDYHAGDILCKHCGLVKEERIIDDTYKGNLSFSDYEEHSLYFEETKIEDNDDNILDKKDMVYMKSVIKNIIDIENDISFFNTCKDLYSIVFRSKERTTSKKKAIMAASVYYASKINRRGLRANDIYHAFDVPLWTDFSKICQYWKGFKYCDEITDATIENDTLTRMVHMNTYIPLECLWKVIKNARLILQKIDKCIMSSTKNDKLNACLIYIACQMVGVKITQKKICELYDVSAVTLKKHEAMIQSLLKKSQAKKQ